MKKLKKKMTFKEKTFELIGKDKLIFKNLCFYVDLIEENNRLFNLTSFTGDVLWRDGIYQSIVLLNESFKSTSSRKMLDIGAGVGFPSIPFLIYKRDFSLYISESKHKRIVFLETVKDKLLLNITFIPIRIEDYKSDIKFDLITARAVTSLDKLIEISSQVGSINAEYSFLKGPKVFEEQEKAAWLIEELSLKPIISTVQLKLDNDTEQTHYLFKYKKIKNTPFGYPRIWALINSN
ncbi:MAG: 16S rRNA (guanine(527)-N(7))-methyltransferase RsmG [Mycoplasmataceae bacterium]|nr:16S rRNA (guanine(527)-N(7))-methyltransferase RsmG [Mycoplasmataceae bacterium]